MPKVIFIDPIRIENQYDTTISRGEDLEWRAPAGASKILVDFKDPDLAGISPGKSGAAASQAFDGRAHGIGGGGGPGVPNFDPLKHNPRGQIGYRITIFYDWGYGTLVIDPFVKILP